MNKIIFQLDKIKSIYDLAMKAREHKWNKSPQELVCTVTLNDIKSFKSASNNGMKWSAGEKVSFEKLSHVEKKKYLINKMGFKGGVLFPNISPDTLYKYPEIRKGDDISKEYYEKGMKALSEMQVSFGELEDKKQREILSNFRLASDRGVLKASKELADLLCEKNFLYSKSDSLHDLKEASDLYQTLARAGSPDGYYGYYKLYRFVKDDKKFVHSNITASDLFINDSQALTYLNLALESGHKQALEDLAEELKKEVWIELILDIMITVGYLYQDRRAFIKAMDYANYAIDVDVYKMFYIACMKMSIILGGGLDDLIMRYYVGGATLPKDVIRAEKLKIYANNRKLVDGLDPYFDELFPPDLVLDFGTRIDGFMYGGNVEKAGIGKWMRDGKMKDPRDKDSTLETVKDFYQKLWQIIIWYHNYEVEYYRDVREYYFYLDSYVMHLLYRKYSSGFASARPYVFPKEVLDMKIDFNKIPPKDLV